ncbi:MAG TPA: VC0807 family protein [Caulobacteraceae bacterium]
MTGMLAKAGPYLRANGGRIGLEALVNFIGPFVIYNIAKRDLGDVGALIASSAPPIAWSLIEFARHRRVDAVSMLVLAGIALSLLAFIGGGGARFLQLREKLVTGLIGLVFLGSAAVGKPLIYQLARATIRRRSTTEAASFEAMNANVFFRRTMTVMTLVWGCGLIVEAVVTGLLVFTMSISTYLIVSPSIGYGVIGALTLWTVWYTRRQRKRGEARRAAEAAGAPPAPTL